MPETDPEVEKRARRHLVILYGVMVFFLVLPFVVYWLKRRSEAH